MCASSLADYTSVIDVLQMLKVGGQHRKKLREGERVEGEVLGRLEAEVSRGLDG